MSLSNLQRVLERNFARFAEAYVRPSNRVSRFAVDSVPSGTEIVLTGRYDHVFGAGSYVALADTPTTYALVSDASYDGDVTTLTVADSSGFVTGDAVVFGNLVHLGSLSEPNIEFTPRQTIRSTKGRQQTLALDCTVTLPMQQTSAAEVLALEALADFEYEVVLTNEDLSGLAPDGVDAALTELTADDGFWFDGLLLGTDGALRLNGDENQITVSTTFTLLASVDLTDFPITF